MRTCLFCLSALLFSMCALAQTDTLLHLQPIGLEMTVPASFTFLTEEQNKAIQQKGKKAIEARNNLQVDDTQLRTLVSAKKGDFEYIDVTITPFDPQKDGSYTAANRVMKEALYNTFARQHPDITIDTATARRSVGSLDFERFTMKISVKQITMYMAVYYRLYKGYDVGIAYFYLRDETRQELEKLMAGMRFR